jgi:transposase
VTDADAANPPYGIQTSGFLDTYLLRRHRFGRSAEKLPEDQLLLRLEDVEQVAASSDVESEAAPPAERTHRATKRCMNRGSLPAHLPRIEMLVDIEDHTCTCCRNALHRIGEDRSEKLDIIPAQLRVLIVRRPKYACRACEEVVVQASAPARLIEGGPPTEATVAQILVYTYADHLPLYRQAQIYARQGIAPDRSTLADWVGRVAWLLRPVHERLLAKFKTSTKLFAVTRNIRSCRCKIIEGALALDKRQMHHPTVDVVNVNEQGALRTAALEPAVFRSADLDQFAQAVPAIPRLVHRPGAAILPRTRRDHPLPNRPAR